MKAITISQPYAELIATNAKFIENRSWITNYRGPLAIHAGKGRQYLTADQLKKYVTGAVVATAELIACIELAKHNPDSKQYDPQQVDADLQELSQHGMTIDQVLNHLHCEGPVAWVLYAIRPASQPFYTNGKQGLWDFEATDHESLAF